VSKFTSGERTLIKSIVATLSIKKIPESEIIKEVYEQTKKTITRKEIYNVRQRIKKESYHWYKIMREGQYEYIHEFKERIDEILWLQRKHHEIMDSEVESKTVKQASLAELHRLNVTLSNYFDVAPTIVNGITLSATPETKRAAAEAETDFIV
jgi:outer membrane protein assembly factor BamA